MISLRTYGFPKAVVVPLSQTTLAAGKRSSGHDEQACEAALKHLLPLKKK